MANGLLDNNWVIIAGVLGEQMVFSHEIYGERFFSGTVAVPRLSDNVDYLPFTISERLIEPKDLVPGRYVQIEGQFRSYNKRVNNTNKLILTIFAREITFPEEESKNPNSIKLNGYVCKPPVYRTTPFNREITDMLIAVNRSYNKSDYIPVISWGRNARYAGSLKVGTHLVINGRIQSRIYQKKLPDNQVQEKIAYEVSVTRIELLKDAWQNGDNDVAVMSEHDSDQDDYSSEKDMYVAYHAMEASGMYEEENAGEQNETSEGELKGTVLSMGMQ